VNREPVVVVVVIEVAENSEVAENIEVAEAIEVGAVTGEAAVVIGVGEAKANGSRARAEAMTSAAATRQSVR
jgi:hypothetical protein